MSDTMTKTTTVHTLTIDNKHGTDTRVFRSAEGARRALAAWAREWYPEDAHYWNNIIQADFNLLPDDAAIECYFEFMGDDESYCLDEAKLEE
jgi:hypothetical protein